MRLSVLRTILRTQLQQLVNSPLVAWEAVGFTAPPTVTWIEDELRAGTLAVAATQTVQSRPLYLLTLHTPPARRLLDLDAIVDAITDLFEPGRTLADIDRTIQCEVSTLDAGAHRVMLDGWGYRRITLGLSVWTPRTVSLTA